MGGRTQSFGLSRIMTWVINVEKLFVISSCSCTCASSSIPTYQSVLRDTSTLELPDVYASVGHN